METNSVSRTLIAPRLNKYTEWLLGLVFLGVGLSLFFKVGFIPGDLGDTRFNMYILEHGYRWLLRLDTSFWNAPIFYPSPNTVALSDNHLGTFLIYSIFRLLGASREVAFQLWGITLCILNYLVTWFVLRKFKVHPIAALAGAYLFSFSFVIAAQMGHIQLVPRFMIPIAFWTATRFLETGRPRYLAFLFAACAYQFYLGFYTGYFLTLVLPPYFMAFIVVRKSWQPFIAFVRNTDKRIIVSRCFGYFACCIAFILSLLPLAIPYLKAQQVVGGRSWSDVALLLPRWYSYLYAPTSYLWSNLQFGKLSNYQWEHQLFIGIIPLLAILLLPILFCKRAHSPIAYRVGFAMIFAVFAIVAATLYCFNSSFYWFIWSNFPGGSGIRAVTRIIVVLLYPVAFCMAITLTLILEKIAKKFNHLTAVIVGCILIGLLVIDQSARVRSVSIQSCQKRITDLQARIEQVSKKVPTPKVLWIEGSTKDFYFVKQIDAMLVGQELGLAVINGYSGNSPKSYPMNMWLLSGDDCSGIEGWVRNYSGKITKDNLIYVGTQCEIFK
jgi:hypothetical protein